MSEQERVVDSEAIDEKQERAMVALEGRAKQQLLERNRLERGEIALPEGEERIPDVAPYAGAGMLNLSKAQQDALMAPIDPELLEVTPDGNVYLPQVGYRRILNEIFGPGNWALVPMSDAKGLPPITVKPGPPPVLKFVIVQKFQLRIYGKFAAEAWGEGDYISTNSGVNKATAAESARSNSLVRCCKDLGIALDCWDKRFTDKFKADYCTGGGYNWKRKPHGSPTP